jgi:hypothetical protein
MTWQITAATQKAGFRVPKTVLWIIKHYFFQIRFYRKSYAIQAAAKPKRDTILANKNNLNE